MEERLNPDASKNETICDCLPACNSLSYDTEVSQADFEFKKMLKMFKSRDMLNE
jgi:hypothetical protein